MTWISLICLLALTSSALGRSAYGNGYGSAQQLLASQRSSLPMMTVAAQGYGQQLQQPLVNQWASAVLQQQKQQQDAAIQQLQGQYSNLLSAAASAPKTLPAQSYGQVSQGYAAMPVAQQFDQQQQQPQPIVPILTEADMLCKGQQAETIIPLDGGRKFIVCLDESKGVEQQCPQGLYYHSESHRCERKLGPLENACATQPCLNGGQCLSYGSSYQCQCAAGFEGETCELDARICQTQQPCGQSPDTKCQSFRLGAALQYICVFQGGLAYGLNAQQVVPSPCQGTDGPQALAVSNNGFIMCDGERLSIESCPGGTIWDDIEKACSWPDMQTAPQFDQQQSYGQSSYGEQQKMTAKSAYGNQWSAPQQTQSYGNQWSAPQQIQSYGAQINIPQQAQMIAPKKIHSHRGHHHMPKHFDQQQQVQSYGAQITVPQQAQMIAPKQIQSYGAQFTLPKQLEQQQPVQSYGAQITIPQQAQMIVPKQFEQQQPVQSYGAQMTIPQQAQMIVPKQLEQQQQTQSYGSQWSAPQQAQMIIPKQFEQKQPVQSYGAQITIPQQAQMIVPKQFEQQQPVQSYGAQITIPQQAQMIAPKEAQPYGTQLNMQKQLDQQQPVQSYGGQITLPKQQQSQPVQSYGVQFTLPQNFQTLTAQVPQKQQQDDFVSVKQSSGY